MNTPKETRFALVLNGGVSLAVWMGGVTHELNRLRLASSGEASPPTEEGEAAVHRAWSSILEAVGRSAVVDTFAGTSAGGLNGTLLAKAVAGGKDLPYMRSIWSTVAALEEGSLLGAPGDERASLLDGKFFRSQVGDLLVGLQNAPEVATPRDCTLLVTATAIGAQPTNVQLEGVGSVSMADSRRVYRFERRTDDTGNVNDDFADRHETMAWAARASASFPVAFEPVWETNALKACRVSSQHSKNSWLIDGGVLDNAPFGPLLESLKGRAVGADFERVVLYVTPSAEGGPTIPLGDDPTAIAVMGQVFGAAREPDQRLDMETLQGAFDQMGFTTSAPHEPLRRLLLGTSDDLPAASVIDASALWFQTYRHTRAEAVERWLANLMAPPRLALPPSPQLDPADICTVPSLLPLGATGWEWGVSTAARALRWWGRVLVGMCDGGIVVPPDAFERIQMAQRVTVRLGRELDAHMVSLDGAPNPTAGTDLLEEFYEGMGKSTEIRATMDEAAMVMASLSPSTSMDGPKFLQLTLGIEVVSSVLAWGWTSEGDSPRFRYGQITPAARSLIDIGSVAASPDWPARKLYGERWGHFGAFASRSGRESDWLWGRLDGASALSDYLLLGPQGNPLLPASEIELLTTALVDAIVAAEGTTTEGVVKAARRALETDPGALILHMSRPDRSFALRTLWSRVTRQLDSAGQAGAEKVSPSVMVRAMIDPTWTQRDTPSRVGWMGRLKLRGVRIYGWPMRHFGTKRVKKALKL